MTKALSSLSNGVYKLLTFFFSPFSRYYKLIKEGRADKLRRNRFLSKINKERRKRGIFNDEL